ncbi:MAG TPA: DMT family transporter [Fimbriimonadaceae bacterium]|nr:DMT family transporter [Fimbriimonadaceae bacterium]
MRLRQELLPNPFLLITVASWGFNFVAVKEAYRQIDAPAVTLLRFLVMWGSLALLCLWRKESLRYPREDALKLIYLGFVSLGIYIFLFMEGMRGSGSTEGAILLQMSPVFTAFLAAAFGLERFSWGALGGAFVAFCGTGLVLYGPAGDHENKLLSNVIVMFAALMWAYSVTLMRPLLLKYSPLRVLTLSMPGALPVMLAYGLFPALRQDWRSVHLYGWAMFFHIAIISGVVAFLCFYQGVRQVGATGATLYQFLVPIAAMGFSLLVQHTHLTLHQLAGFLIVLAGVGYALRARSMATTAVPVNSSA